MSYIGIQKGNGIGSDALQWVKENPDKVAQKAWENRGKIFQYLNNSQRFVEKNIKGNKKPIRYLDEGEIHIPLMAYCGPGTNLKKYRNFTPYNAVDNACRTHDLAFEKAFKLPLGSKERKEAIRDADKKAVQELDKYKGMYGQKLARGGLALKQRLEDINPSIIRTIMGDAYVGVEPELKEEEEEEDKKEDKPVKACRGRNRRACLAQRGGAIDPITGYLLVTSPIALGILAGQYKLGKSIYNRFKTSQDKTDDSISEVPS